VESGLKIGLTFSETSSESCDWNWIVIESTK
jgi:hypothetical protein